MAQAHTDTMDTRKLLQPVVKERPARGREMQTQEFAEEDASEEGAPRATRATQAEVFHEGYVGGKKFLVPDSNLDAMADMINLKMRRMETSKYMSDSDAMKTGDLEDNYLKKKESLFKKLDGLAGFGDENDEDSNYEEEIEEDASEDEKEVLEELPSSSSEEEDDEEEEEAEEEEGYTDKDELEKDDKGLDKQEESEEAEEEESKDEEKSVMSDVEEEEEPEDEGAGMLKALGKDEEDKEPKEGEEGAADPDGLVPVYYHDPNVKRFLISGHFRSNKKPFFIIQQYEGQSAFKHKDPQFFSHQSEEDVDIFIAGEFYKESILEEDRYEQPIFLKTKPRKVVIDWRSRIYEEKFTDVFIGDEVDVELSGSFIKHSLTALHTPLLSIVLRKGTARAVSTSPETGPTVYVMRPIVENLFEKENAWQTTRRKRSEDKRKSGDYEMQGGRKRTGFQYPEGARLSGPMTVYVSHPETHSPWQRSSGDQRYSFPTMAITRDVMRETLVLPETSRRSSPGGRREHRAPGVDLNTTSARREHIRRTLSRDENPSVILEAFVKSERDKIRERRQKAREKVTMGNILSQLFLSK